MKPLRPTPARLAKPGTKTVPAPPKGAKLSPAAAKRVMAKAAQLTKGKGC